MYDVTYFVMSRKRDDNLEVILCTEHKMSTFVVIDFVLLCTERGVVEKGQIDSYRTVFRTLQV